MKVLGGRVGRQRREKVYIEACMPWHSPGVLLKEKTGGWEGSPAE